MQKSTTIYVHSVYNLLKVITLIDLKKTILDIHGVVPEELLADNKKLLSKVYNMVEKRCPWMQKINTRQYRNAKTL